MSLRWSLGTFFRASNSSVLISSRTSQLAKGSDLGEAQLAWRPPVGQPCCRMGGGLGWCITGSGFFNPQLASWWLCSSHHSSLGTYHLNCLASTRSATSYYFCSIGCWHIHSQAKCSTMIGRTRVDLIVPLVIAFIRIALQGHQGSNPGPEKCQWRRTFPDWGAVPNTHSRLLSEMVGQDSGWWGFHWWHFH